jgi:hypothetical protein
MQASWYTGLFERRRLLTPEEIQQRIEELDSNTPKNDAEVLIYYEEEGQDCEFIGNRSGYLRLGVEMLKAAIAPLDAGAIFTPISIDYLLPNQRSLRVKRFTRQEDVQAALPPLRTSTWKTKAQGAGCLLVVIFLILCTLIGIGQVFTWVTR